jgi:hypothetical protein
VQPGDAPQDRALTGTGRADKREAPARLDLELEVELELTQLARD